MTGLTLVIIVMAQELAMTSDFRYKLSKAEAIFDWAATVYDFGEIKVNVPVTHEFTFTNTGDVPLVITSVQASCGCTVTSYSTDAIEPGAEGSVKATFNAAKIGQFTKSVTVNANTAEGVVQLSIKGEVVE